MPWLWGCRVQPRAISAPGSLQAAVQPRVSAGPPQRNPLNFPYLMKDIAHHCSVQSSSGQSSSLQQKGGGTLPSSEDVPQGVSGLGSRAIACLLDVSTEIDFLVGEMTVVAATLVTIRCDSGEPREGPGVEDDDEDATLPAELGEAAGVWSSGTATRRGAA